MTGEEMLTVLAEYGADAVSDLNDGDEFLGWFGWSVGHEKGDTVLTVSFEPSTYLGPGPVTARRWRLEPLDG